ncbi:MAG TPA: hypothetical protein VFA21_06015 [Pyrinomonadaceae bacterium]|jgi:hypothetical protein|nr:hypothetical protein [Pyrinomonadaceae bacterium]
MKFNIYPKKGDMFTLEFRRFTFNENSFTLYDEGDSVNKDGFLSFDNIAAIMPQEQGGQSSNALTFKVYLKNRTEPLEVIAYGVNTEEPPSAKFYGRFYGHGDVPLNHVFIALSEVVAIIPSDGLKHRWR